MDRSGARRQVHVASVLVMLSVAILIGWACAPARAATFTRAFTDDIWFRTGSQEPLWLQRTTATGAKMVLLEVDWLSVEPNAPPAGVDPTNPAGPQYDFSYLDARVKEFAGSGLSVAFLVTDAPPWAEAPGGPANFEADGSWQPNATAYGQLAKALATRYSGSYPDPMNPGAALPRVRYFQAWGEANFSIHLAPQWARSGNSWVPVGPSIYRNMLNAFYAGIKSVHSDNVVITTGFGPYGDPPGPCSGSQGVGAGCRMHPALFARTLMCLTGQALRTTSCPNPPRFDALAMDPYQVSSPTTPAFNIDDVTSPDLGKLTRILNKAGRSGRALPQGHKQLWVTEFSYDSNPPNPGAVSLTTQARWLEQALYLFWKQGVSTAVWYLVADQVPTYDPNHYYSGVYFNNGARKPSFEAYRFPFLVWPSGRSATVWGIAPRGGTLVVQRQQGRSWKALFRIRVSAGGVFVRNVSPRLHGNFRAVVGGETSLIWSR
jgi:hypothetical protein